MEEVGAVCDLVGQVRALGIETLKAVQCRMCPSQCASHQRRQSPKPSAVPLGLTAPLEICFFVSYCLLHRSAP